MIPYPEVVNTGVTETESEIEKSYRVCVHFLLEGFYGRGCVIKGQVFVSRRKNGHSSKRPTRRHNRVCQGKESLRNMSVSNKEI